MRKLFAIIAFVLIAFAAGGAGKAFAHAGHEHPAASPVGLAVFEFAPGEEQWLSAAPAVSGHSHAAKCDHLNSDSCGCCCACGSVAADLPAPDHVPALSMKSERTRFAAETSGLPQLADDLSDPPKSFA